MSSTEDRSAEALEKLDEAIEVDGAWQRLADALDEAQRRTSDNREES